MLVIEVKQVSNWRDVCKRAIDCASEYEGDDPLTLRVDGLPYSIELPNNKTLIINDWPPFCQPFERQAISIQLIDSAISR